MKADSKGDDAFIGGALGIWLAIGTGIAILLYFANEAGIFDTLNTGIGNFFSIFLDGADLGEWLGGIFVGIMSALWTYGVSIGTAIWD